MPTTPHIESHFTSSATVRDIVIGMADGLTVPFALAAGLSGAIDSNRIIVTAGVAEIAAGAIAMGLGGYLAARGDSEHYENERAREVREIEEVPERECAEIVEIFEQYSITPQESAPVVEALKKNPPQWVEFMMRFELGLERPDPRRALRSAATIGGAYVVGGLIPLSPYIAVDLPREALPASVGLTLAALALFGGIKGRYTGTPILRSAVQTALIGGVAAAAAFFIASWIG